MCFGNFGKLTKKIYCSLLSGALLFVLLSMFSKCYCLELNDKDIANAIYNIANAQNVTLTKNDIDLTICETIANTYNNNQGKYLIATQYNYNNQIEFYLYNGKAYLASNTVYASNSVSSIRYSIGTKEFVRNSFSSINPSRLGTYYFSDANIYSGYNSNIISISSGTYQPSNFDMFAETLYINDYFSFNYISGLSDISIEDFNTMKQINSNFNTTNYVAEFGKYINLDTSTYKPTYTIWKYEKTQNYFEPLITYDYSGYSYVNDDLGYIYLNSSMLIPNTIIEINLKPTNLEDFITLSLLFYITDSNTIINNGDLDIDNTFNDNYYNRYNNLINNLINENVGKITNNSGDVTGNIDYSPIINGVNNINNTLTDDSDVDNILSSNLSGDYETFGEDIGYQVWENPFFTFLYNIFEDFYDALTVRENIQISLNSHNINNWVLNTDDFVTPSGSLKNVCRVCLIFFYIYFNYRFFYHLITLVQTFRIKTTISVLGTDEFYDTDYM